jgi:hypothetical protein
MNMAQLPTGRSGGEGRKPIIAFMGEFSAGKSTLCNLMMGASPLPTKVTATQLPPVWVSYGDDEARREDIDGTTTPIDLNALDELPPERTRVIRIYQKADILDLCDLIDMPGISDPNMPPDLWQPVAEQADLVIWCTHATQAWRQSEAAAWAAINPDLYRSSLLLVTRFDKLLTERDRERVLRRVRKETDGLFADCLPISLTDALAANDDRERWEKSGAEAFTERLLVLLNDISRSLSRQGGRRPELPDHGATADAGMAPSEATGDEPPAVQAETRIVPRRVRARPAEGHRSPRPPRGAAMAPAYQEVLASVYADDDLP